MDTQQQVSPKLLFIVTEDPDGGYTAKAPAEGIYTQGDNWEALILNSKDAILCHFEDGKSPDSYTLHTVKREVMPL
jgi:predicted RNase H-like HicB family nuclease